MKGRDLLTLHDFSPEEIGAIITLADELKEELARNGRHAKLPLEGKTIALYFEKRSLRTRVSFEVGINQLGGNAIFLNSQFTHAGRGEPLSDTGKVLSRYVNGIVYRAYRHEDIVEIANNFDPPVINALCDRAHPCQILADLQTIYEKKGRDAKVHVAYVGDYNNVSASLMVAFSKVGIDFTIACPQGYQPDSDFMTKVGGYAAKSGATLKVSDKPLEAVQGADFVYTDVWVSMGMEEEEARRREAFKGYCVTNEIMEAAGPDAIFMHDLPAHRGEEVAAEVIDGPRSIVFDQAENRLHAQKAVLSLLMGD